MSDLKIQFTIFALSTGFLLTKINIGKTGNQVPPSGGFWLPVFTILIFLSWGPADNAKTVNNTSRQPYVNIYIQAFVDVIILAAISQYYNYTVVVCSQMCNYVVINETISGVENN